jgi:hypothetical protein
MNILPILYAIFKIHYTIENHFAWFKTNAHVACLSESILSGGKYRDGALRWRYTIDCGEFYRLIINCDWMRNNQCPIHSWDAAWKDTETQ